MKNTLALILAALAVMIGSFIWFVATWDATLEEPISATRAPPPAFILAKNLPPEGRSTTIRALNHEATT